MRPQNGPPLSMGQQLRFLFELQVLHSLPVLRSPLLRLHNAYHRPVFCPLLARRIQGHGEIQHSVSFFRCRNVRRQLSFPVWIPLLSYSPQSINSR